MCFRYILDSFITILGSLDPAGFKRTSSPGFHLKSPAFGSYLEVFVIAVSLVGCGSGDPFKLAPVEGKVTYSDGSLIEADEILLKFVPQGIEYQGKLTPRAAQAHADVSNGSFEKFTTWKYGDGVMVGNHKVVVLSTRINALGVSQPTMAVPKVYHRPETTPLEVEVTSGANKNITLEIEKGGK